MENTPMELAVKADVRDSYSSKGPVDDELYAIAPV